MKREWMMGMLVPMFIAAGPVLATGMQSANAHREPVERAEAAHDAGEQLSEARQVIAKMKRDPDLSQAMRKAKGIFVMPDYARGALGVGVHGGNGVLLVKNGGKWSGPALYNTGGVSIGLQAGGSAGQAAFLLMSDKAVRQFEKQNDFALNADAGITVLPWSAKAHARTGGDVMAWSDQAGLYAGASIGVTDINFDENETAALYGRKVSPRDIIEGRALSPQAASLLRDLSIG